MKIEVGNRIYTGTAKETEKFGERKLFQDTTAVTPYQRREMEVKIREEMQSLREKIRRMEEMKRRAKKTERELSGFLGTIFSRQSKEDLSEHSKEKESRREKKERAVRVLSDKSIMELRTELFQNSKLPRTLQDHLVYLMMNLTDIEKKNAMEEGKIFTERTSVANTLYLCIKWGDLQELVHLLRTITVFLEEEIRKAKMQMEQFAKVLQELASRV